MTDEFKPQRLEPIPDGYRKDELSNVYADAYEQGLWIREIAPGPTGVHMCAVGSYYTLQEIEFNNPEIGDIDPHELSMGDCIEISIPGTGSTRVEAIRDGIEKFYTFDFAEKHKRIHEEVNR